LADDLKEDEGLDGPENPDGPDAPDDGVTLAA
jgi:hypothetical protein